jgi:hypothetical protein
MRAQERAREGGGERKREREGGRGREGEGGREREGQGGRDLSMSRGLRRRRAISMATLPLPMIAASWILAYLVINKKIIKKIVVAHDSCLLNIGICYHLSILIIMYITHYVSTEKKTPTERDKDREREREKTPTEWDKETQRERQRQPQRETKTPTERILARREERRDVCGKKKKKWERKGER